jgi:site-specific DNA-methyltransferase (adenine-specific)
MKAKNNGRYNGNGREWRTPPEVYDPLNEEFHFDLDPCTTEDNPLGTDYWFTEEDDGLTLDWDSASVFMNPPYGREIYAWTRKACDASAKGALVVGLLPASTDLAWWHEDVVGCADEVRYIRGRVRFLTDGPYRASGFFASVIVIWRPPGEGATLVGGIQGDQEFMDTHVIIPRSELARLHEQIEMMTEAALHGVAPTLIEDLTRENISLGGDWTK